jgi:hypothetical protein
MEVQKERSYVQVDLLQVIWRSLRKSKSSGNLNHIHVFVCVVMYKHSTLENLNPSRIKLVIVI